MDKPRIAVVGLGYVGLPLAAAFGRSPLAPVVGFDINPTRIKELRAGTDASGEITPEGLADTKIELSTDPAVLRKANFIIVAVPTPVTDAKTPDLTALRSASEIVGKHLSRDSVVVFESTVYPGATEDECGPIIERASGLRRGTDWKLGYSPERINPGDREHGIENIIKVVSGEDPETLERIAKVYGAICRAGVHRASTIAVAETAKVIENTQRDVNIALINEIALICHRLGISIHDVLAAAGTKWNFHQYSPGLVGGHCIGVDPYYLTFRAQQVGFHPDVILAGRRINDSMGFIVADRTIRALLRNSKRSGDPTVNILGLTFKENIRDTRNSRVEDVVRRLASSGIHVTVFDPMLGTDVPKFGQHVTTDHWEDLPPADATLLLVPHRFFRDLPVDALARTVHPGGWFFDLKGIVPRKEMERRGLKYATL